jgi:hypothetical protein
MYWNPQAIYSFPYTINDVMDKHTTFLCEFVDLKRNGYHHFSKAYDNLTYGFWGPWLKQSDTYVSNFAEHLKLTLKLK